MNERQPVFWDSYSPGILCSCGSPLIDGIIIIAFPTSFPLSERLIQPTKLVIFYHSLALSFPCFPASVARSCRWTKILSNTWPCDTTSVVLIATFTSSLFLTCFLDTPLLHTSQTFYTLVKGILASSKHSFFLLTLADCFSSIYLVLSNSVESSLKIRSVFYLLNSCGALKNALHITFQVWQADYHCKPLHGGASGLRASFVSLHTEQWDTKHPECLQVGAPSLITMGIRQQEATL